VQPPVSDGRSNLGRRALVAVFVAEALEDALGRVALLDRRVTVIEREVDEMLPPLAVTHRRNPAKVTVDPPPRPGGR
jgi:ParB-like chromosome segregation protein Spo0J